MDVRNFVGLLLIVAGLALIFLRARKTGDIQLTGGIWDAIGRIEDQAYLIGVILVVIGAVLIAPDLGDVLFP
ncbi:MAG: hypothetical protein WEB06_20650 [Actinomycetota bacterium]